MTILGIIGLIGFIIMSTANAGKMITADPKWKENHKKNKEVK